MGVTLGLNRIGKRLWNLSLFSGEAGRSALAGFLA
jgi:hypothetical protein